LPNSSLVAAHFALPGEPGYKPPGAAAAAAAAAEIKATAAPDVSATKGKGSEAKASGKATCQADDSKKNKKVKGDAGDAKPPPAGGSDVVDVSLLDLRVGNIVTAEPHPESDKLYLEKSASCLFSTHCVALLMRSVSSCRARCLASPHRGTPASY
jgi:hypothetical protein